MDFNAHKLFSKLQTRKVPEGLLEKIMMKVSLKQRRRAIWEFVCSSLVFVATLGLLVPAVSAAHNAMVSSGFYQYIALIFSNFSEVMSSWQDFMFSLLESLPVFSIIVFLAILFFLLASLRYISRDAKILFHRHHSF